MDGKTLRISSAHYSQVIELSSGAAILVRRDGQPHRYCDSMDAAEAVAQWAGAPAPWNQANPGKSDDGWDNRVSLRGETLATIREVSRVTYDEPETAAKAAADSAARVAAPDRDNDSAPAH